MERNAKLAYNLYHFSVTGEKLFDENELKPYMLNHCRFTLYRGLLLPTSELKVGGVIEQWGACSHWTANIHVALSFTKVCDKDGHIVQFGLGDLYSWQLREGLNPLSKAVLRLQGAENVLPLGRFILRHSNDSEFAQFMKDNCVWDGFKNSLMDIIKEEEYSLFDYNFVITSVEKFGDLWCVDVIQTPKTDKCREEML